MKKGEEAEIWWEKLTRKVMYDHLFYAKKGKCEDMRAGHG